MKLIEQEAMMDIVCLGEPLYEFSQQENGSWRAGFGGDVSNVAIAASRLGASTGIITNLGEDGFGDALMALWQQEGVVTDFVKRLKGEQTGLYFIRYDEHGHNFEYRRAGSAASKITPKDIPKTQLQTSRLLHVSGISQAISETSAQTVAAAVDIVKKSGGLVSYDPNLRLNLWSIERARETIHNTMKDVDIVLPGLDDARQLTGLSDAEKICQFYLDLGVSIVALTLGAEGALIMDGGNEHFIPAREVEAVDASGAGDCFDGAFIAEWLRSRDLLKAGRFAVNAASLSTLGYGAVAPLPALGDVEVSS